MKNVDERKTVRRSWGILASIALVLPALLAPAAQAQPNGNEMCGDGTTFTVQLPGVPGALSHPLYPNQSFILPQDSVTIPNGCSIYAIFVTGYSQNKDFDQLLFYKTAKYVAANNGYVHWSWWNNLVREYQGGPLHDFTVSLQPFPLLPALQVSTNPGGFHSLQGLGFAPQNFLALPKAIPDEDIQFQADARALIQAIKAHNPNAIIVVAGHSMGGEAVARLGQSTDMPIDLLAPIDPVGNRDSPVGLAGTSSFNWTRWRAARSTFRAFKMVDCIREPAFPLLCKDFDPRLFHFSFRCQPVGNFLPAPPVIGTFAPGICAGPYIDPGVRRRFSTNIKHLYHRWQKEFLYPFDFDASELFAHYTPLSPSVLGPNFQNAVAENPAGQFNPDRTCAVGQDPRISLLDPLPNGNPINEVLPCDPFDGHGEIIGFRGSGLVPGIAATGQGVEPINWPTDANGRRAKIIELATADDSWPHRPLRPNLCMVCDDMITIIGHLLAQQAPPPTPVDTTAPTTVATATPGPDTKGWNNEDVVVTFNATDNSGGSNVKEIEYSLSGAELATVLTAGATTEVTLTLEGTTTITFFARDNAGNVEILQTLEVKIDKTPPENAAVTDSQPNAQGWHKTDVLVSFPASDALSGLESATDPILVTTEGANQEFVGTAVDLAGNQATATVTLNIDKTPPSIALASRAPAANAAGWNNSDVAFTWDCADSLSGPSAPSVPQALTTEGAAQMIIGTCVDLAGNTASDAQSGINIDKTPPASNINTPPNGAVYLLNAVVNSNFGCTDSLSGVASCTGTVASGAAVNTATVGTKQFTVHSADVAGNTASANHGYSVHYAFSGFANPIGPMPMINVANAGRTVPVKYFLQDASGAFITNLASFSSLMSAQVPCDSSAPGVLAEETDAAGSTAIHYDATANQFVYNWKTEKSWAGTCRALQLTLNDGAQYVAMFRFN